MRACVRVNRVARDAVGQGAGHAHGRRPPALSRRGHRRRRWSVWPSRAPVLVGFGQLTAKSWWSGPWHLGAPAPPLLYYARKYRSVGDETFMASFEDTSLQAQLWTHEVRPCTRRERRIPRLTTQDRAPTY